MERMKRERAASTENKARLKNSDTLCSGDMLICLPGAMVGNGLPLHDSGVRVTIPDNQGENHPAARSHDSGMEHSRSRVAE
ncbi:hypothetical protein IG631_10501 [Alternaria alternata]|nr:hypothetical protein IG631_10501 [Alternaria alternata]